MSTLDACVAEAVQAAERRGVFIPHDLAQAMVVAAMLGMKKFGPDVGLAVGGSIDASIKQNLGIFSICAEAYMVAIHAIVGKAETLDELSARAHGPVVTIPKAA